MFTEITKNEGILVSLEPLVMIFPNPQVEKIYWNTQLFRAKKILGNLSVISADEETKELAIIFLSDTEEQMKLCEIPISEELIDPQMWIAKDALISINNGVTKNYQKYEQEYTKWTSENNLPNYFQLAKKVDILFNIANKYHGELTLSGVTFPDPKTWIENQEYLRKKFDEYREKLKKKKEEDRKKVITSPFFRYSIWMYDQFPPTFGEKMKKYDNLIRSLWEAQHID